MTLSDEMRKTCREKSAEVVKKYENSPDRLRIMCPLNVEGLCTLYQYRPMICRLHGLPNEFRRPDNQIVKGPGCDDFTLKHKDHVYIKFDRTPFYIEMAQTERELKNTLGIDIKLKLTVSEMILSFDKE